MNKFHITLSNNETNTIKKSDLLSENNGRIFQSVTSKLLLTDLENSYGSTKFGSDDKQTEIELNMLTSAQNFIKEQNLKKTTPIFAHIPPKPFRDSHIFLFKSMDLLLKHLIEYHFNDNIKFHFPLEYYSSYVDIKPFTVTIQKPNDDHFLEMSLTDLVVDYEYPIWSDCDKITIDNITVSSSQLTRIFKIIKTKVYNLEAFLIYLRHFNLSPTDLTNDKENMLETFNNIFMIESHILSQVAEKYLDVNTEIITLDEQFIPFINLSKWFESYPIQDKRVTCFNNNFFFLSCPQ